MHKFVHLTDLYAFSARFIQLLNRKLAYVCIADYYKSEQNVLFCLTLIIIFMKKHFFNATFWRYYRWLYGLLDVVTMTDTLM